MFGVERESPDRVWADRDTCTMQEAKMFSRNWPGCAEMKLIREDLCDLFNQCCTHIKLSAVEVMLVKTPIRVAVLRGNDREADGDEADEADEADGDEADEADEHELDDAQQEDRKDRDEDGRDEANTQMGRYMRLYG